MADILHDHARWIEKSMLGQRKRDSVLGLILFVFFSSQSNEGFSIKGDYQKCIMKAILLYGYKYLPSGGYLRRVD